MNEHCYCTVTLAKHYQHLLIRGKLVARDSFRICPMSRLGFVFSTLENDTWELMKCGCDRVESNATDYLTLRLNITIYRGHISVTHYVQFLREDDMKYGSDRMESNATDYLTLRLSITIYRVHSSLTPIHTHSNRLIPTAYWLLWCWME